MGIAADSRYVGAVITTATGPDGSTRQEMRTAFPRARVISYTYERLREGDRVDTLAFKHYGKASLWWMIADANPEIIDWFAVEPGTILRIPNA